MATNDPQKNVLCKHLVDGTMICTYGVCFFAHSLEQWNVPQCKFPRCRDIFRKEGKILNNKFSSEICMRQHVGETYDNMLERCGLNHLIGKKVESKPKHVLICSQSSFGDLKKNVIVAGLYNRLEIWDEALWKENQTNTEKEFINIAEHLTDLGI